MQKAFRTGTVYSVNFRCERRREQDKLSGRQSQAAIIMPLLAGATVTSDKKESTKSTEQDSPDNCLPFPSSPKQSVGFDLAGLSVDCFRQQVSPALAFYEQSSAQGKS
jgi:hypothetical protein